MKKFIVLVFAFSILVNAQNTPAPCDPANLQASDVKYGCYNTPDCITGFMCFYIRVMTDVFYGTTCSETPMYLCSSPNIASTKCSKSQIAEVVYYYRNPSLSFTIDIRRPSAPIMVNNRFWWKKVKV